MKTKAGATALHYASGSGAEAVVRGILSDPKNKSLCKLVSESGTPLHWAAAAGDGGAAIIEHLVTASPETINQPGGKHQLPPLIIAVAASKDDIAAKLVEHGADCGAILSGNITIAHIAADNGLVKTLAQLVQNDTGKKCLEMRNAQGELPIDLAAENDYTHCVQVLMGTEDMGEVEKKIKELKAAAEARGSKSGAGAGKPQEGELGIIRQFCLLRRGHIHFTNSALRFSVRRRGAPAPAHQGGPGGRRREGGDAQMH